MPDFPTLPLGAQVALFAVSAIAVWRAGNRLAVFADILSDRLNVSRAFMGFIFLAVATELPEIVTNITAALKGNGLLVLNSMFGGITMQTAVLAVADFVVFRQTLTFVARNAINLLQGAVLALLLALLLGIWALGDVRVAGHLGLGPVILAAGYIFTIYLLRSYERDAQWRVVDVPEEMKRDEALATPARVDSHTGQQLFMRSAGAAVVILIAGVILVNVAEQIAISSGLGYSFIGVTLLATATSLPELSTSIAAVRMGAHSMAISNVFGSNLIMIFLLLPADIFYSEGLLLHQIDASAGFALVAGIVVTAAYLIGMILRKRNRLLGMGYDSLFVLVFYILTLFALYGLRA